MKIFGERDKEGEEGIIEGVKEMRKKGWKRLMLRLHCRSEPDKHLSWERLERLAAPLLEGRP
ncbi:hypothetical protein E2C01_016680 [Portunus trituberculatus]|uniref:Uncharacterized protein n=1 Tax=Portunus trituberculatus TaxID=210409 RepID=A0A5B7DPR6_PORTR|nr:hypothetical protein [Portunus trituberculatus]